MSESAHWQARPEAGTFGGLRFLMWIANHMGRGALFALLKPVVLYFLVVRGPERRASRAYLARALARKPGWLDVYRHFLRFAEVTSDRFFFLAERDAEIPVRFVLDDAFERVMSSGQSGIFLAAHFGSFEAARVLGPQHGGIRLRIVLDKQINARFVELMEHVAPEMYDLIIDSEQGSVALGLSINEALKNGDWVGFLADRFRPADRTLRLPFLGDQAVFPAGPYLIANTFKAPVIGAFCRLTETGYEVHLEVLSERVAWPRAEREAELQKLAAHYVSRLEHHVRAAPFGWFNFYEFWAAPSDAEAG